MRFGIVDLLFEGQVIMPRSRCLRLSLFSLQQCFIPLRFRPN